MAQKINPTSFRLGTTQVWNTTLQTYGKSYFNYFLILHKYLELKKHLQRYFFLNSFLLDAQNWTFCGNKIFLNLYCSHPKEPARFTSCKEIIELITKRFSIDVIPRLYLKSQRTSTVNLLASYASHLLEKNVSPKRIIWSLCQILEQNAKMQKCSYFKFGILNLQLIGFKIQMSGRFSNSKNQMSKRVKQSSGSLPLTCIKSSVEYLNTEIYTKLGVCGLQIWLFYEINE